MMLTSQMVRALRGAPITVLVLMMLNPGPLAQSYLRRHTGYTDPVIHDALELLRDYGQVNQVGRYTWQIASGALQLPLMALPPEPSAEQPDFLLDGECFDAGEQPEEQPQAGDGDGFDADDGRSAISSKLFLAGDSSSSSRTLNNDSGDLPLPESSASSKKIRANLKTLDRYGIREPARSKLAKLEHVTPELIAAHCAGCKPGQAIYRIEHNWPAGAPAQDDEDRSGYVTGKYSDFITH